MIGVSELANTNEGKATDGTPPSSHGKVAHGKRELWSYRCLILMTPS